MKLAKGSKQNYADGSFKITKVVHMIPRPVYELEVLNVTSIEGEY
jgi:hypothetical protein